MKKFLGLLMFSSLLLSSIWAQNKVLVADRDLVISKSDNSIVWSYDFKSGDKILLTHSCKKEKNKLELQNLLITQENNQLFNKMLPGEGKIEFVVPKTGKVNFAFTSSRLFTQSLNVMIERIPQKIDDEFWEIKKVFKKYYDTTIVKYEIDSVVEYKTIKTPKKFDYTANVDFFTTQIKSEKFNIKGLKNKSFSVTKPQQEIIDSRGVATFKGYQVIITSAAGADAMWKAIGTGLDIGCLAMGIIFPVGGTVASGAAYQVFDMIGPQEGGEPVYFMITDQKENLDKFLNNDNTTRGYEFGLVTGYNATWRALDNLYIGLRNLNIAAEINVSVAVYAIYQFAYKGTVSQDIITVEPVTKKVSRQRTVITNNKKWQILE